MDLVSPLREAFHGKRVLVTGHTGFKGSWLSLWLGRLGAQTFGAALDPPARPSMFEAVRIADTVDHAIVDIRDQKALRDRVAAVRPDLVFHLAAQSLVRESYDDPLGTFSTNVMGTAHLLEAVRAMDLSCSVVVVSSDKCYDNRGWVWGYRETDPLGGHDPYSASKGATEIVASSWRDSYFGESSPVRLATGRAGNVIGGGDWAADRIVPDCIRAFAIGARVKLRNPLATRPWQHVLEPLGGYLLLAARMAGDHDRRYTSAWNFGPATRDVKPVEDLVDLLARHWGADAGWDLMAGEQPKEARTLALNCDKAAAELGWFPTWSVDEAVSRSVAWYRAWHSGDADLRQISLDQISDFEDAAREAR